MRLSYLVLNIRREFLAYDYKDPAAWLRSLREIEPLAVLSGLPYKVRSLRTHALRRWNESRQAALFAYGIAQRFPESRVDFSLVEHSDYDCVIRRHNDTDCWFTPVQLKELVPEHLPSAPATLAELLLKLSRYSDSSDLVVAVFLNRRFRGPIENLPHLKLGGLYFFGAANQSASEWQLTGDVLGDCSISTFAYPQ